MKESRTFSPEFTYTHAMVKRLAAIAAARLYLPHVQDLLRKTARKYAKYLPKKQGGSGSILCKTRTRSNHANQYISDVIFPDKPLRRISVPTRPTPQYPKCKGDASDNNHNDFSPYTQSAHLG